MQLNEIHDQSEHASISLKTILLVFAIALIGVLGYLVYQQNMEVDTTDYSTPTTTKSKYKTDTKTEEKTITTDPTAGWKTYTNTKYGFALKLPENWGDYKSDERTLSNGAISVGFDFPYTSGEEKTYYQDALQIVIYPLNIWETFTNTDGSKPTEIGKSSIYVFTYAIGQDLGGDSELEAAGKDIQNIVKTFKLIQ